MGELRGRPDDVPPEQPSAPDARDPVDRPSKRTIGFADGTRVRWSDLELPPTDKRGSELKSTYTPPRADRPATRETDDRVTAPVEIPEREPDADELARVTADLGDLDIARAQADPAYRSAVSDRLASVGEAVGNWWYRVTDPDPMDVRHHPTVDRPEVPGSLELEDVNTDLDGNPVDYPLMGPDGPKREDVRQKEIGDCWVMAPMGAVAGRVPDAIRNAIKDNGDGTYKISLHHTRQDRATEDQIPTGKKLEMTVTRPVPVWHAERFDPTQKPAVMEVGSAQRPVEVRWAAMLEKGFAGLDEFSTREDPDRPTGYKRLDRGGSPWDTAKVLAQLTGERAGVVKLPMDEGQEKVAAQMLRGQVEANLPTTVATRAGWANEEPKHRLRPNHAYEVVAVTDQGYVQLHNPWGRKRDQPKLVPMRDFLDMTTTLVSTVDPERMRREKERVG